jgi:hypothetical protein
LLPAALVAVVTTLTGDALLIYLATERQEWAPGELIGPVLDIAPAAAFAVIGALIQRRWHAGHPKKHDADVAPQ